MKVYQSRSFETKVKKMLRPEKDSLDREIRRISDDPGIGEGKKGDLKGFEVDQPQTFLKSTYTEQQGQFLAYIHHYSIVNGRPPAEADMQRFFQVTPPSVHSLVLTLERREFIRRVPGQARSITLMVPPESLPPLKRVQPGPFKP